MKGKPFSIQLTNAADVRTEQRPRAVDLQVNGLWLRSVRGEDVDNPQFMQVLEQQHRDSYLIRPDERLSADYLRQHLHLFDEQSAYLLSVTDTASQALLALLRLQVSRLHQVAHLVLVFRMSEAAYTDLLRRCIPALAQELFAKKGVAKLSMQVSELQAPLVRALAASAIFELEGTLKREYRGADGQRHDVLVYGLLNPKNALNTAGSGAL